MIGGKDEETKEGSLDVIKEEIMAVKNNDEEVANIPYVLPMDDEENKMNEVLMIPM